MELTKKGSVFYWGVCESHHETVQVPITAGERFTAIFRRYKGFYDGEPWGQSLRVP